jgi:hypothetical protein
VSFATITFHIASQQVFIVVSIYFIIDSVWKLSDTPSCTVFTNIKSELLIVDASLSNCILFCIMGHLSGNLYHIILAISFSNTQNFMFLLEWIIIGVIFYTLLFLCASALTHYWKHETLSLCYSSILNLLVVLPLFYICTGIKINCIKLLHLRTLKLKIFSLVIYWTSDWKIRKKFPSVLTLKDVRLTIDGEL